MNGKCLIDGENAPCMLVRDDLLDPHAQTLTCKCGAGVTYHYSHQNQEPRFNVVRTPLHGN